MSKSTERGAVAVEFALLAPILVMLLLGIMEFGRAYNCRASLTNAAREGVRVMAIDNNQTRCQDGHQECRGRLRPALSEFEHSVPARQARLSRNPDDGDHQVLR